MLSRQIRQPGESEDYISPTFRKEPPDLLRILITQQLRIRVYIRVVREFLHDFHLGPIDFDIHRGRAMGRIRRVCRTNIRDFQHHV